MRCEASRARLPARSTLRLEFDPKKGATNRTVAEGEAYCQAPKRHSVMRGADDLYFGCSLSCVPASWKPFFPRHARGTRTLRSSAAFRCFELVNMGMVAVLRARVVLNYAQLRATRSCDKRSSGEGRFGPPREDWRWSSYHEYASLRADEQNERCGLTVDRMRMPADPRAPI